MDDPRENVIEWITGDDMIACTFTQKKYVNRVRTLISTGKIEGDFRENADGSIFCHLPLSALKLGPKRTVQMSEDQKAAAADRLQRWRAGAE